MQPTAPAISLSLHSVCTLVSDADSRGLSAPTLSQAGHAPMCPLLQGEGLALEAADVGYSILGKAQAGRKSGACSTHSLMAVPNYERKSLPAV